MTRVPNSELEVLQVLWTETSSTAKRISEALLGRGRSVSVSSVQTLLRRLEARGLVAHRAEGKTFRYVATCRPDTVRAAHARDLVDRMFGGAVGGFVTQLIEEEDLSDEELRELRDLVDSKLQQRGKR